MSMPESEIVPGEEAANHSWSVVRREDGTRLARYASKAKALSAARRFSADGCTYDLIKEFVGKGRTSSKGDVPAVRLVHG